MMARSHPTCAPIDANGNLTADGTRTFEWDALNQLVAVDVGTHLSEFSHDGEQRRVRIVEKEEGVIQSDTKLIWCRDENCEGRITNGVTVMRRSFIHGEHVAEAAQYFARDHLGSVAGVTDAEASLLARYTFDPWGRRSLTEGGDVTTVGYTGHRMHEPSELALSMYRGYNAPSARWLSEDPAGSSDGLNLYRYVSNNPINSIDRLGLAGQRCWDKLTITSVVSCSAEFVSSSGFCGLGGAKGNVAKLCEDLKKEITRSKRAEIPAVPCPRGETCQDKKPVETFEAVNETLTFTVKTCTVTIRLTGSFIGNAAIGTCRGGGCEN